MLEKNEKMNINKCVILALLVICLMFTSVGVASENSYAVDLNESNDNVSVPIDMEDELESPSINEDDLKASNVTEEVVQASGDVNGSLDLLGFSYDETGECWTMNEGISITPLLIVMFSIWKVMKLYKFIDQFICLLPLMQI